MGKFINAFASFLGERVDILIMPRKGASTKFKLHRLTILVILLAWLCVTAGGILFFIRGYDYNVIKADNHLMHLKLQLISDELERGRKYIELTHTTDTQMRQMLGMPSSKFSLSSSDWEKKKTQQDERAQKLFSGNLNVLIFLYLNNSINLTCSSTAILFISLIIKTAFPSSDSFNKS